MKIYKIAKLNKIASLTLHVSDYNRDTSFDNIHNLSWKLKHELWYTWMDKNDQNYASEFCISPPIQDILTMDGFNVDSPTGTINFYIEGIQPTKLQPFINNIINFLKDNNVKVGNIKEEQSRMFKSKVIRIPILSNPKAEKIEDRAPEVNMSNNNAFFIFNTILGYKRDLWDDGAFDPKELKTRIEYYEGETHLQEGNYAGQPYIEVSPQDALNEDMLSGKNAISNYDENKVRTQLNLIKEVCNWAITHGYKQLYAS